MRRMPRLLLAVLLTAVVTAAAAPSAGAKVPGPNGRIVFGRFDPAIDDFHIITANPDGTQEAQLLPGAAECPRWAPDGSKILVCLANPTGLIRPATVNPQGSGFTLLDNPDPTLNLGCWAWSPNGARLACEGWDDVNVARPAGIFTVRSSDGRGLVRVTANPYGDHDIPGDFAPDGSRIVFLRTNPLRQASALFVVNTDGTGCDSSPHGAWQRTPGAGPPTVGGSCSPSPEESSTSSARMAADSGGSRWTPVPAAPSRSSRDGHPTASGSCFPWPCRAPATKRTSSRPEPTAPTSGGSPTRQTLRSSGTGAHLGDNVYRYGPWPPAAATGPERPGAISTRCPNAGPLPSDLSGARAGRGQGPAGIGRRWART